MRQSSSMFRLASVILAAIGVSACATFETGETKLQRVKTVGIVSAVGDQMTFAKAGLTGLDNSSRSFPIESWELDKLIVKQAAAALSGRFQVQPVNYKRAAFAAVEKDSPLTPVNLLSDPFRKLVETEVSPPGLDAYVVITKARANFGTGGRKIEGIGFVTRDAILETSNQIHALYEIRVIDGKTFDVIEKRAAAPLDNAQAARLAGPSRPVDESFSPSSGHPARNDRLRRAITDLIVPSLSTTLSDMHLAETR
jgi:hypothetical protein